MAGRGPGRRPYGFNCTQSFVVNPLATQTPVVPTPAPPKSHWPANAGVFVDATVFTVPLVATRSPFVLTTERHASRVTVSGSAARASPAHTAITKPVTSTAFFIVSPPSRFLATFTVETCLNPEP